MAKAVSHRGKTQMRSSCQLLPKGRHPNPLQILEPNRKRLSSLKAERVLRVLQEIIKNTQIVLILPNITESLERFSVVFGETLCSLLKDHEKLREKYEECVALVEEGKRLEKEYNEWLEIKQKEGSLFSESSSNNKSETSQTGEEFVIRVNGQSLTTLKNNLVLVREELVNSMKNILRKCRSDPTSMKTILEQARHLTEVKSHFITELKHMKSIVRERLLTSPVELQERKYYIGKVVQRENKILKIKEKLQFEYDLQIKIKMEEEGKQFRLIYSLKEALHNLNETASKDCSKLLSDASKRISSDIKYSEGKQRGMVQDSIDMKKAFYENLKHHVEDEREKRKRKFKLSTEVFNWIQKFDADMGMRQEECDEIVIERDQLRNDLDELGKHFLVIEKEYLDILEARKLAEDAEEERKRDLELKTAAVIRLQSCWRGYRVRKQLKKKVKKGKKGKKK